MSKVTLQTRSHSGLAEDLRISITRLSRRLRRQGDHSLTITHYAALAAVNQHSSMTPRELALHEKVQPPSMTRVIAALEKRGLLERRPHPTDGRQVVLNATEQGRALVLAERRRKEAWLSQRLMELTPEDRETLRRAAPILKRLSNA